MENILVITGSPRKGGNSSLLADAFIKGAQEKGHTVTRFDSAKKKIGGCIACGKCYTGKGACIFNDDFNELAPLVEAADMVVLATPLYWFTFPAQIKAAMDKFYAMIVGKRNIKDKQGMMLVCAETHDMTDFEGIVRSWEIICRYLEWTDKGTMLVPNVNRVGDILKTGALKDGEALGYNL